MLEMIMMFFLDPWSVNLPASGPMATPASKPMARMTAFIKSDGTRSCINSKFPMMPSHRPRPATNSPVKMIQTFRFFHIDVVLDSFMLNTIIK